ncbi:MAG: adenosylmethionine--8-amino-7-oxononanoate transaminase [Verrucomicrobiota bacterium]
MHPLAKLDRAFVWHPFTQMRDWMKREPIVITSGRGAVLRDVHGREYLDANASIWTNLHGHQHPKINRAIQRQLGKIAHSSALGFANEPASLLAAQLVKLATLRSQPDKQPAPIHNPKLAKVFFSDNGSTATEVALKLAYECARRAGTRTPRFLSLEGAYHGDTVGAVSLGHIDLFHKAYAGLLFKTDHVMAPYCYRCPFNRAKPERADARDYRQCRMECLDKVEQKLAAQKKQHGAAYAGFVFEPLLQGAAGVIAQPKGWLREAAARARAHGALLIADEVMTGFGRTGTRFACHQEGVQPDFLCLAKGLTGGYLPMAATLTTNAVFNAFLGEYEEFKTFFHGHSFTGNQLGSAAALASLEILESPTTHRAQKTLETTLRSALQGLWELPQVGDMRQVGLVAGIELVRDWHKRQPFDLRERAGIRVCEAMARRGVLTRPVGNVIMLMPPYCTTPAQVRKIVQTLYDAVREVLR